MRSQNVQFAPDTFVREVKKSLEEGRASLSFLVAAYNWGSQMLKAIKACSPTYDHEWLRGEIKGTFNVDPDEYCRAARKFGGGRAAHLVKRGEAFIEQVGLHAALASARKLSEEEATLVAEAVGPGDAEALEEATKFAIKARSEGAERTRVSYKQALEDAQKEIQRLRTENSVLQREIEMLREIYGAKKAAS